MPRAEPSRGPVARGDRYCSPACGRGCTRAEYDAAVAGGAALVRALGLKEGWKAEVWENLGWHYKAISACGRWKVHPTINKGRIVGYTAYLGANGTLGGRWSEHGKTPQGAVKATYTSALADVIEAAGLLDARVVEG